MLYVSVCATLKPDEGGLIRPFMANALSDILRLIVFSSSIFSITVNNAFNDNEFVVNRPCTGNAFYKNKQKNEYNADISCYLLTKNLPLRVI